MGVTSILSKDATKIAEEEAAKTAAAATAKAATKTATATAGKEAAKTAATAAEKDATKTAEEEAAKNSEKSAEEEAAKNEEKAAADTVAKEAEQDAAQAASRDAGKTAAQRAKQALQDAADFVKKNPKLVIAGATALALSASAGDSYTTSSDTPRNIQKVEKDPNSSGILITFSPNIPILPTDTVNISNSETTPSIDGNEQAVTSVVSDTQITLDKSVTGFTAGGTMNVNTTFSGQVAATAAAAGGAVGTTLGDVTENFACGVIPSLCKYSSNQLFIAIGIVLAVLCILSLVLRV